MNSERSSPCSEVHKDALQFRERFENGTKFINNDDETPELNAFTESCNIPCSTLRQDPFPIANLSMQ